MPAENHSSLTAYVAQFITETKPSHIPADVTDLGKRSILDGIGLADGRKIGGRADFGKGSPANPMSDAEFAAKFRECAAWGKLPKANADKVVELVLGLEKLKSIRELTRLLSV